uniref:DUF4806 domain-containing protein n=1 Tax=Anopheles minimus TaxID=112268 RepID=A0A182WK99_9DIPT
MLTKREKKTGKMYRFCKRLENQFDQEYDAEQLQATIKVESGSEGEQEIIISTTTSEALLTSLKMTCSDNEDSSNGDIFAGIADMPVCGRLAVQNESSMEGSSAAKIMNMITTLSKQVAAVYKKTDRVEKEVATISERLGRVEKKVGMSLATLEQVKDVIGMPDDCTHKPNLSFEFKKITNEEEFLAFDSKLGDDEEYYSQLKKELVLHIQASEPDNRMHEAMDMIFDLTFMPLCSWTGHGAGGPRIKFRIRSNILRLFADIGSNKFNAVNQHFVQEFFIKKLRHAKERLRLMKGLRKTSCRKRKRRIATPATTDVFGE